MSMNLDINHFKNELSDYYYLKSKIATIEDKMLELDVRRGMHSPVIKEDVVQGSPDPEAVAINRLEDIEQADYLERELMRYTRKLDRITNFLKGSEIGGSIMRIHCTQQSTYEKEAESLFTGVRTLKRRVNREIVEYLEREEKNGNQI